jgi:hypothetical protein
MDFEFSSSVYCHDLINPPAHDRDCDINLGVTKSALIQFTKETLTHAGTKYLLRIPHAEAGGFTSDEQHIVSHEFDNLILAFNLVLERVCVTRRSSEFSEQSTIPKKVLQSANVTRTDSKVFVEIIDENIVSHDSVHATVTHSAEVEERAILEAFRNLQRFNMFQINENSSLRENNLKKSLENYSNAMEENNIILKFRDLFTALELCVNIDGNEKTGPAFDDKANKLYGINLSTVSNSREFYNRVKHVDRSQTDIDNRYMVENGLPQQLTALRNDVGRILISELK